MAERRKPSLNAGDIAAARVLMGPAYLWSDPVRINTYEAKIVGIAGIPFDPNLSLREREVRAMRGGLYDSYFDRAALQEKRELATLETPEGNEKRERARIRVIRQHTIPNILSQVVSRRDAYDALVQSLDNPLKQIDFYLEPLYKYKNPRYTEQLNTPEEAIADVLKHMTTQLRVIWTAHTDPVAREQLAEDMNAKVLQAQRHAQLLSAKGLSLETLTAAMEKILLAGKKREPSTDVGAAESVVLPEEVSVAQAAKLLGMSGETVRRYLSRCRLTVYKKGKANFIQRKDFEVVAAYAEKNFNQKRVNKQ